MLFLVAAVVTHQSSLNGIGGIDVSNRLATQVVELFNRDDAKGIEALAEPEFFKVIPASQLPVLVSRMHALGTYSPPKLVLDLQEQRRYRVVIRKDGQPDREIEMILGAGPEKFFSLSFAAIKPTLDSKAPLATDNPVENPIDRAVQASIAQFSASNPTSALSLAVYRSGRTSFYNYGPAGSLPTPKTVYEIGSITKTMTGLLVAQAVLEKKMNLDDDIRKHLPGFHPNLEFQGQPILLRHLVSHTSGLPANPPGIPDDGAADAYERFSHRELLENLATIKLTRTPGTAFGYSNMGAGLVGVMLERVYGKPFESLLRDRLFGPHRMRHTGIALTPEMDRAYATPFDRAGKRTDRWTVNGIEAAGAVRSTAEDMLKFARLNMDTRSKFVNLAQQPQSPPNGKATGIFWGLGNSRLGGPFVNHEGGTGGFTSHILVMPKTKLAVVVLTNVGEVETGGLAYEIALRLLSENPAPKKK